MTGIVQDYEDSDGIKRRVLVPDEYSDPSEGIPVSLEIDRLYDHMPGDFRVKFVNALWARELITVKDFIAPNAPERIRAALLEVVKHDAFSIVAFAHEQNKNSR